MDAVLFEPTLYAIKGIVILDNEGNRIFAKYYDEGVFSSVKKRRAFEENLYKKTQTTNSDIVVFSDFICVYRSNVDLLLCVVGSSEENELILDNVLQCLYESLSYVLRKNVEKRAFLENFASALLTIDEICDKGVILDIDAQSVVKKVAQKTDEIPFGDNTVLQIYQDLMGADFYD